MNTLTELSTIRANLADIVADLVQDPSPTPVEQAVAVYKQLAAIGKEVEMLQGGIKDVLDTALAELGADYIEGAAGKVMRTAASTRETWDGKVLTRLCMDNPAILTLIGHARKVTQVPGGLRIT